MPVCVLLAVGGLLLPLMAAPDGSTANRPAYGDHSPLAHKGVVYRFAIHPLYNPRRLFSVFFRMMDSINQRARDFEVRLIASRNYQSFEARVKTQDFEITLSNPLQALYAINHGYHVIGKMGDDRNFCGVIFTRRDSGINSIQDLKGKVLAFPSSTALAATMMPLYFLANHGLDMDQVDLHFVGSQESAIMNVFLGKADAGGTWPMPWEMLIQERAELDRTLKVLWRTPPLVNNAVLVRDDVPEEHARVIMDALTDLEHSPEGRDILEGLTLSRFERCNNTAYEPVAAFLKDYIRYFPNAPEEILP
jgi:phosphonate transport system substrate-binding protein